MKAYYREINQYKYQLTKDFSHKTKITGYDLTTDYLRLETNGLLYIKKGYCWDGPSGPTFDTPSSMRGSLVHDALYQLIRMGLLPFSSREVADELFYAICLEDGMWRWRAWLWYRTVKKAAASAAEPGSQKDEIFCVGREK